tara:strand:+ start:22453 stop:24684 length:2232 start_codon:yes stop_codon:yes gene_type:complete
MQKKYYAHSGEKHDKSDWQALDDHLVSVGQLAKANGAVFGAEALADVAGLLHDLGKYTVAFQNRLEGGPRVDHATAGAKVALEKYGRLGRVLSYVVAGHHAGLANGLDIGDGRSTLEYRLKKEIPELDAVWKNEIALPDLLTFPQFKSREHQQGFQTAFLIRMIFSCLVDADYLDTEKFYKQLKNDDVKRGNIFSIELLKNTFEAYLAHSIFCRKPDSDINVTRRKILDYAIDQSSLESGLFSMTVPTGGGKTFASMAFALNHAEAYDMRRVIYVIPFTSIIEQNANEFRKAFSVLGDEIVLEHHSAFDDSKFDVKDATKDKLKLAMENWDAPIVITTAVQFFESLFSDRTSRCRKLHNIAGSVIILDEAQMLPLKLLRPTMVAIEELARNYKCSIVLCTATQPSLLTPDFENGFEREKVREIAPNPNDLYKALDRTTVRYVGELTDLELVEMINSREQILVIVNSRRHARELFNIEGIERNGLYHLTTLMCAKHRSEILDEIREKLKAGEQCKVIATSLIEAGVDISFPMVMRAEAGLDSIAQAAGRCNREAKWSKDESEVLIFKSPEWKPPSDVEQFAASMRQVLRRHESSLLSPAAMKAYFNDVYWRKEDELDAKYLLKMHSEHFKDLSFPFQNIAKEYRIIESIMLPIICQYDAVVEKLVKKLRFSECVGDLHRELQPYLVQVPRNIFDMLKYEHVIEAIQSERFGDQFMLLINPDLYCKSAGFSWNNPHFLRTENLFC